MKITNRPSGPLRVNTYLTWDEDSKKGFIVDPGGFDPGLVEQVKQEGIDLLYIILTHGHGDHIGGVRKYQEIYPDIKLVCTEAEKAVLADPRLNMSGSDLGSAVVLAPDVVVDDQDHLQVGNMDLYFLTTPGHTPGGMSIVIDKVVFSGDTLFRTSIGRTDFPGGSYKDIMKSIREKLFKLPDDTLVLPGHMDQTTIGFEKENNPFVI